MSDTVIKIGGVDITPIAKRDQRMSLLLWGPSGSGKTTLAATAPGRKLLILFDPDGDASIMERDDVDVVDLSAAANSTVLQFKGDRPLGLDKVIDKYDTIIIDSITNAQHMTVMHGSATLTNATIEKPTVEVWGMRTALMTQLVLNILRLTRKHNKHVIFIAHEAQPDKDDKGIITAITVALGGQSQTNVPVQFSEVWNLSDTGKVRRIAIRPSRMRAPCKTRMFKTDGAAEFEWKYDPHNIATWYNAWREGGYQKLPLPK